LFAYKSLYRVSINVIKLRLCSLDETKWNQGLSETSLDSISLHQGYMFFNLTILESVAINKCRDACSDIKTITIVINID